MFDDFKDANIYLFIPFVTDNLEIDDCDDDGYLECLKKITKEEFKKSFSEKIKRKYLGTENFIIADDNIGTSCEKNCRIYLTYYECFFIATIIFELIDFEPTIILSQASTGKFYIMKDGEKLLLSEYFVERFSLESAEEVGEAKCFTSLIKKPIDKHFAYMMACESYILKGNVNTNLTAEYFYNKLQHDLSNYDSSEIYASEKNVVYILRDAIDSRLEHESLTIFIIELITLQLCAINANYKEIIHGLDKMNFSQKTIDKVNSRYSRAAMLWNIENYRFLTAKRLAEDIAKEFGLSRIKEEYNANLNIYEKLTTMNYSKNTQNIFLFFATLSALPVLTAIIVQILGITSICLGQPLVTIIAGIISVIAFVIGLFLSKRGRKNKKTKG